MVNIFDRFLKCAVFVDLNDHSPDEGLIEDFAAVDKEAVEQLTEGLISHYLPDLQRSKLALKELTYVHSKSACICLIKLCGLFIQGYHKTFLHINVIVALGHVSLH